MTDRRWATFNPGKIVPKKLTDAVDNFDEKIVQPYIQVLDAFKLLLAAARLALFAAADPILLLIDTAIAAIQTLLRTLLLDFGFHVLFVPIIRTNKDVPRLEINTEDLDGKNIPLALADPPVSSGAGGNWGFYSVFANSLSDEDDLSRPQYPDDFAIMSFTLITGASNVGEILKNIYHLAKLMQEFTQVPLDSNLLPVPQNLKLVTTAPQVQGPEVSAGDGGSRIFVILRWDRPALINLTELFVDTIDVTIDSTSVYMRKGAPFTNTDVGDALGALEQTRIDESFLTTRVAIRDLDPAESYYFAVGFNITVTVFPADGDPIITVLEHYDIGNQIRIQLDERQSPASNLSTGRAPDWVAITAPLDIIPGVGDSLKSLLALLAVVREQIASPVDEIDEFIEDLEAFSDHWLKKLRDISAKLQALNAALRALRTGFSIYGFHADSGGSDLLLSEMNRAFFDTAVQNRPPFEGGGDVVAGMVFAAAAPGPDSIRPLLELYQLLFGDVFRKIDGPDVVSSPEDPDTGITGETAALDLSEALETIMRVTAEVERSTDEMVDAAGFVPEDVTADAAVTPTEVAGPCLPDDGGT